MKHYLNLPVVSCIIVGRCAERVVRCLVRHHEEKWGGGVMLCYGFAGLGCVHVCREHSCSQVSKLLLVKRHLTTFVFIGDVVVVVKIVAFQQIFVYFP